MDAMDPKIRTFYQERLREIVRDGTQEGALVKIGRASCRERVF